MAQKTIPESNVKDWKCTHLTKNHIKYNPKNFKVKCNIKKKNSENILKQTNKKTKQNQKKTKRRIFFKRCPPESYFVK